MERYAEYKATSIPWLDEIPSHWEEIKVKFIASISKGNGITKLDVFEDGDTPCVRYGEIYTKYNNSFGTCFSSTFKEIIPSPRYFEYGNILVSGTGELVEEIGKSVVYVGNDHCLAGGDIIILKHSQNPIYLNLALNTKYVQEQKSFGKAKLKVVHISSSEIGGLYIALPPLSEQEKIVTYIEGKTSKIDAYIAEKEKEVQLLNELKESEIAKAVTQGLNPQVKMKDSGISWIGMIPEHWEVKQLRAFLSLFSDKGHGDAQLLSVTREQGVILRDKDNKEENHNFVPDDLSGYKYLEKGDFVVNKMKAWQGSYAVSKYDGIVSPAYYTCKLTGVDEEFFSLAIRSKAYVGFFTSHSKGIRVGQWDLDPNALKSIPFFLPSIAEQQAIVAYIDNKCAKINSFITELEAEVDYLKEYKQRLIADCVTGQVNVLDV